MSLRCRCLLLRALCDLRAERPDARDLIDLGQLTAKAQEKLHAAAVAAGEGAGAAEPIIYEPVCPLAAGCTVFCMCCTSSDISRLRSRFFTTVLVGNW